MPRIKDSSIEEVRNRVNIVDLVSSYVSLKRAGASFKGLSPFTSEKTPSFFVYPDKGFYYCFSTSQGGDIFKFVQTKEGLNFPEAVEFIANRFGVPLEYDSSRGAASKAGQSLRKQIFDIHEDAANWFLKIFKGGSEFGKAARKYWHEERKFKKGSEDELRIGMSPVDWSEFKSEIEKKYSYEAIVESGLFFAPRNKSGVMGLMPRFRGRLMISLCDVQGRVVAFTARKTSLTPADIDYEEGKYVNSPETPIFKKQNMLFNFHRARKSANELGYFIIVEGQIDALRMYVSGFQNTVAGQGTALGENQFNLIKRHVKKSVLMLDGDSAGQKAARRVLPIMLSCNVEPYVCVIPEGEDPDTLILKNGADGVKKLLENKSTAVSFMVDGFKRAFPKPSVGDKRQILEDIYSFVSCASSHVAKYEFLREASSRLGANFDAVVKDYLARYPDEFPQTYSKTDKNSHQVLTNAVYDVLLITLNYPDIAEALSNCIDPVWIDGSDAESNLLRRLIAYYRSGEQFDVSEIEDEAERNIAYKIMTMPKDEIENPVSAASKCFEKIHKNYCEKEIFKLQKTMDSPDSSKDEKRDALKRISSIRSLLRETKFII